MGLPRPLRFIPFLALCLLGLASPLFAGPPSVATLLETVLSAEQSPPGVVIEIVDRDEAALKKALPWVAEAARRLRARFPQVPMAVVSHGREMFALKESTRARNLEIHDQARRLGQEQGIPIHVCETHAGWRGLVPEDFPKYIDVAPTGPVQIRNYQALGYVLVKVPRTTAMERPPGS